jgi:cell division control protein 24
MKQWGQGVDAQRREHATTQSATSPDASTNDFPWMREQITNMPNPYAQQDDDDDDDDTFLQYQAQSNSGFPRNASSTSLRSRSTTGESTQSLAGMVRGPPPRFPMQMPNVPPLSLQTQIPASMPSPGQRGGDSYFSPVAESPASSRTSGTASMFPFPRQGTPQGSWEDSTNRYTAPALARVPSRESSTPVNAYNMSNRSAQRPSLPAMAQGNSQASIAQQRSRSYSTPDINAQPGNRRSGPPPTGPPSGPVPAVPNLPSHIHAAYNDQIPRSSNSSPSGGVPIRTSTQSPSTHRERMQQNQFPVQPQYSRSNTTQMPTTAVDSRLNSPNSAISTDSDAALPTQLKVKVNADGNYVTLVVAFNITYQSLIDRIDAKVGRFSNNAIARGTMRLRYRDEDGDFVTIESDDDIQIAFQEWREAQKLQYANGQLGEIELFCLSVVEST